MKFLKAFAGKTYIVPLAILAALLMLAANEGAYWQSKESMNALLARATLRDTVLALTENLIDVESSQRGYVLTGNEALLKPIDAEMLAIEKAFESLAQRNSQNADFIARLADFRVKARQRLSQGEEGVRLRRAGRREEAIDLTLQRAGTMDAVHALDDQLLDMDTEIRAKRRADVYRALLNARVAVAALTLLGLLALLLYLRHARQAGRHQQELKEAERTLRDKLKSEVAQRTGELTNLTRYLLNAREDERNRLARNLHDDLGALLTSAKLDAARIKPRLANVSPEALELLAHLVTNLNACVALGRGIVENLRPSALSNLGLVATLEILVREFSESSGIKANCQLKPVLLDASSELIVYRVVQESLTNITKYAHASEVWVKLDSQGQDAIVTVRDNGVGFDTSAKPSAAYGLLGMRFRVEAEGGSLVISSSVGGGTTVQAAVNQLEAAPLG
jgi:signal transduction histidine kinase